MSQIAKEDLEKMTATLTKEYPDSWLIVPATLTIIVLALVFTYTNNITITL